MCCILASASRDSKRMWLMEEEWNAACIANDRSLKEARQIKTNKLNKSSLGNWVSEAKSYCVRILGMLSLVVKTAKRWKLKLFTWRSPVFLKNGSLNSKYSNRRHGTGRKINCLLVALILQLFEDGRLSK